MKEKKIGKTEYQYLVIIYILIPLIIFGVFLIRTEYLQNLYLGVLSSILGIVIILFNRKLIKIRLDIFFLLWSKFGVNFSPRALRFLQRFSIFIGYFGGLLFLIWGVYLISLTIG